MDVAALLALPAGVHVSAISQTGEVVVVTACTEQPTARCPVCDHVSIAIHSRYHRTLRDLPCGGHSVRLFLTVRKFFCQNSACLRRIFTERLPSFTRPSAQMTCRLQAALQSIGLATSGSLGARLAHRLGIHTSWTTILRRIMDLGVPTPLPVTVLGIDDFALRRGHRYGTILVDLTSHRILDLLPERSAQSAATWMRQHTELRVVSRDRGQDYTQAIVLGAPQALAVADRFHLLKNLIESCDLVVGRCWKELRQVQPALPPLHLPKAREWRPAKGKFEAERQHCKKAPKQDHYDLVHQLRARGLADREIAERLQIPRRTISRWMRMTHSPGSQGHRKHPSKFDPYARHVLARWKGGCRDVSLLWEEIRQQGFTGSVRTVYRFIRTLRQHARELPEPSALDRLSLQECLWLIARREDQLRATEKKNLESLCEASPTLAMIHALIQSFGHILRHREGERLAIWKQEAATSGIAEVQRFVTSLERDAGAVAAALTVPFSNGPVEGFVNKLKLIKRTMFGRAGFPLLRQRVLHAL